MRETRLSGSEGGVAPPAPSLPLSGCLLGVRQVVDAPERRWNRNPRFHRARVSGHGFRP